MVQEWDDGNRALRHRLPELLGFEVPGRRGPVAACAPGLGPA